ncbi:hypothetical protein BDR07DRAFT_1433850 [Suillus spraguei]|nr:hypothetical protein BDR07DRAFT_1433850 [Suillus spraguei]
MRLAGPRVVAVAVSHKQFTPNAHIGSVVVIQNGTNTSGRGSSSPLMRAFASSKPLLLSCSTSLPLFQRTDSYLRRRVLAAGTKEVVGLDGALLDASDTDFAFHVRSPQNLPSNIYFRYNKGVGCIVFYLPLGPHSNRSSSCICCF